MCSAINHPDQCEEKGCHQTMRDHLDDGTVHCSLVHHQNGKQYKSAMANRRVGVNIFKEYLPSTLLSRPSTLKSASLPNTLSDRFPRFQLEYTSVSQPAHKRGT